MESSEDIRHIEKLKSKLKVWAIIQIIIALAAIAFTIIILTQINPLIQQKYQLQKEKSLLEDQMILLKKNKAQLQNEIVQLLTQKQNVELELNNKQLSLNKAVDILNKKESVILTDKKKYSDTELKNKIVPQTSAEPLGKEIRGRKAYLFKLWIEAPEDLKNKIRKVEYLFDNPGFTNKLFTSQNAQENFSIQYRGWGCLSLVEITIFPKNGKSFDIYFDMCAKLGPEWK